MPRLLKLGDDYINIERIYRIEPDLGAGAVFVTYEAGFQQPGRVRIDVAAGKEKTAADQMAKAIDPNLLTLSASEVRP